MYKCSECGCEFENPAVSREYHGLEYGYEEKMVCPNCGEGIRDEDQGTPCKICGEEQFNSSGICEWCLDEARGMLMVDFNHFTNASIMDMIDLFTEAIEMIYVEEKAKERRTK